MVKPKTAKWQKNYEKLVQQQHLGQVKATNLSHQIHRLLIRHADIKLNIAQDGQKYAEKIEAMDHLRHLVDKLLHSKKLKLTPQKKESLRKMKMQLPSSSLLNRIRLMELLVKLPKNSGSSAGLHVDWLWYWHGKDIKRLKRQERGLDRLNKKTLHVISDIHDLQSIIKYVQKSQSSKFRIKPVIMRRHWLEPTNHGFDVKATIATTNKNYRKMLDVRPRFILQHVPKMMPNMYSYLDN
ncbi:uncharacterized protein [Drosophila virilis]|uniref:Uncharacterized protein n=1 Tax=Drosophila virilis TaxID=7244 RepID=B4LX94_DROVI|nr:uncharacterized protein LOC6631105 [Drosophila virilis]XP_032293817.1 uncharacterized protein LOC6631105 [Drosophila virilis]XP_032293822.1 uncharacterized protein LOC6631105 [Drosophila virilis]EDW66746.1 uncharacterized protein Dvir_GJ23459 [Drosophila virilis]